MIVVGWCGVVMVAVADPEIGLRGGQKLQNLWHSAVAIFF